MRLLQRVRPRAVARLGSAAVAAGLGLVAFSGIAFGGVAFGEVGASAVPAPKYIGIVISGHGSYCVRWTKGITGDTVLNEVATVAYRSDGLIVQIDRSPSSGTADDTHYWSYWHDTAGTWQYSTVGASGFQPPAGSVEGWSYDDGRANPPQPVQRPAGLYSALCGAKDATVAPTPSRSTAPRSAPSRSTASKASAAARAVHAPSRSTSAKAPASIESTRSEPSAAASSASPAPASNEPVPASAAAASAGAPAGSSGSPTGLFVGLGLALLVAGGGVVLAVRRRGAGT